jgi:kumamolisin
MAARRKPKSRVPENESFVPLEGSERSPSPTASLVGPADPAEVLDATIVLRRRPDGPPLPDAESLAAEGRTGRDRMSSEEFARLYGASESDIADVVDFAQGYGLAVVETHPARRTVVVRGTVEQMARAFAVEFGRYEHDVEPAPGAPVQRETYRGRTGSINVPAALEPVIVGVFGLDNRRIGKRNAAEPPNTTAIGVPTVAGLYNYPTNSAAGQTIGIFSLSGYASADIPAYFAGLPAGYTAPTVTDILVNGATNPGNDPFGETTQDIEIAAAFAPGAGINVYITTNDQAGWVAAVGRFAHPSPGDATCSVLSSSWYIADGDDSTTLSNEGVTTGFVTALTNAMLDAAIQGVTVCIACGDTGTDSKVGDGHAHVQYPGSDPWVLSVGGTTVGNVNGASFDEYVWNDGGFATGGGVSDFFAMPSYQSGAHVPASVNDATHRGRGVPDVAGNANPASGYSGLVLNGGPMIGNGTSASAPQWAGLIAVINAALGYNVGFVNPLLYSIGSSAFRDIAPGAGPADNGVNGVTGYPLRIGWDACTGWGSPNGVRLLAALGERPILVSVVADHGAWPHACVGDHIDDVITIGNSGYGELLISAITSSSAEFTVPDVQTYPIAVAPGDSIELPIRFSPTATGTRTGILTVVSNSLLGDHQIHVSGQVGAPRLVVVAPDQGSFGKVCVGSHRDEQIWLSNSGDCTLSVTQIASSSPAFVGPEALDYPLEIAAGAGLAITVRFEPTGHGNAAGTLTFLSNDSAGPRTLQLSGIAPTGHLSISGDGHFGPVELGARAERSISVSNTGECDLHVTSVSLRPIPRPAGCVDCDDCGDHEPTRKHANGQCCESFKITTNPFPATLRPGASLSVLVRFTPRCGGSQCCEIVIESDDPADPVTTLYATGSLTRTLRSALKCWAASELRTLLDADHSCC